MTPRTRGWKAKPSSGELEGSLAGASRFQRLFALDPQKLRLASEPVSGLREEKGVGIESLRIENVDEFLACLCKDLSHRTGMSYRAIMRGFLRWARVRGLLGRDLAPMIVGPRCYSGAKPPTFLRAD